MGKQKCIACKRKFDSDRETLLCDECYEKYKQHIQLPKQVGVCPVCGGNVQFTEFYAKIYYAGEKLCSDKKAAKNKIICFFTLYSFYY